MFAFFLPSTQGRYGPWIAEVAEAEKGAATPKALRLFCLPPVGMGGSAFHPWAAWPGLSLFLGRKKSCGSHGV